MGLWLWALGVFGFRHLKHLVSRLEDLLGSASLPAALKVGGKGLGLGIQNLRVRLFSIVGL